MADGLAVGGKHKLSSSQSMYSSFNADTLQWSGKTCKATLSMPDARDQLLVLFALTNVLILYQK